MSKGLLKRTLELCRPYASSVAITVFLALLRTAAELSSPLIYRHIIDVAVPNRSVIAIIAGSAAYGFLSIGVSALGAAYTYVLTRTGLHMTSALRATLLITILKWPLTRWDGLNTGQVQARVISDTQSLQNLLADTIPSFIRNLLAFPTTIVAALMLDWKLAIPCLALAPAYILPARYFGARTRRTWQRVAETRETLFRTVQDTLQGVRIIKALASETMHVERLRPTEQAFTKSYLSAAAVGRVYGVATSAISLVPVGVLLGWGGILAAHGLATVGTIVAAVAYVQQFYSALSVLPNLYVESKQLGVFLERTFEYLDISSELSGTKRPNLRKHCDVALSNVCLSYGERVALDGVSLQIKTGQTVALVGPSGSGKSSVAMIVLGMYRPFQGRVTLGGVDLGDCDLGWVRRHIGIVAQDPFLFAGSIRDNIAYSRPGATLEEVVGAAKLARIHDFICTLPRGYDTECGERGVQLSGGQRQRIVIARTILQNPVLLILDEATSALDMKMEAELAAMLRSLMQQRTTLVISHRPSAIEAADYVYVLSNGHVIEEGTPDRLRTAGNTYRQLSAAEVG